MSAPEVDAKAPSPTSGAADPWWKSPLLPLFLTVLVDVLALTIVLPLLPLLAERYGASPFVATSIFACFAICQFISGPLLGRISDRVGRKPTLLVSQLGTFAGLLLIGLTNRLELLFLGRIIDGLTAGNLSIAQAYIVDVTRVEKRTKAFGLIGIAFGVGFLVGPALSGWLADHLGYHAPFLFAAGLSAVSVTLTATILPRFPPKGAGGPHETRLHAFLRLIRQPQTNGRLIELFFFAWSFSLLTSCLALFLKGRFQFGASQAGYVFAFSGIVGGSMQGAIGRLAKRLGEARLSLIGMGAMLVGYLVLSHAFVLSTLLVAVGIGSIGSSFARPALTTLLTETVDEREQGLALGISQSLASLAQVVGPLLGGVLIDRDLLDWWAYLAAAVATTTFLVRAIFPSKTTRRAEAPLA